MNSMPLDPLTHQPNLVDLVKSAAPKEGVRTRPGGFSFQKAGVIELLVAPIVGLYLGYSVGRLPEVFESMDVPHLPMILMLVFLAILGMAVPSEAWGRIWHRSRPIRLVAILLALAVATIPVAVWPSGSAAFVRNRYVISIVVFLCCLIFLRDRRAFRWAVMLYVLCITSVASQTLATYDPNKIALDEDGNPVNVSVERSRLYVGSSLDPNDFGLILAATFPLALWLGVGSLRRRLFWGACALTLCAAVVPTASRGSLLAFGATATALLGLGARGWRRVLTFLMIGGGVALFLTMASGAQMGRFTDFSTDDYNLQSGEGRWTFWKQGFVWMIKRPWGYGIDGFPTYYDITHGGGRSAHSIWVQYGMELGVTGLITFIVLCRYMFRSLYAHRAKAIQLSGKMPGALEEEALASHMIAMLVAILVADSFLSQAYGPLTYMTIGLISAVLLGSPLPEAPVASATERPTAGIEDAPARMRRRIAPQWTRQS